MTIPDRCLDCYWRGRSNGKAPAPNKGTVPGFTLVKGADFCIDDVERGFRAKCKAYLNERMTA